MPFYTIKYTAILLNLLSTQWVPMRSFNLYSMVLQNRICGT